MNWLLIVLAAVLIWRVVEGVHKGMVKEIVSFISLLILCAAALLLWTIVQKYLGKDILSMIVGIVLLLALLIVHKLLGLVFFSAKVISKLPVIHSADKLLGAVIGVLETVVLVWTLMVILPRLGVIGSVLEANIAESKILSTLALYNPMGKLFTLFEGFIGKLL